MKPNTLVTLTTDFGLQDAYVGVMKGVIWGIAPQVNLVDLTHGIAPQDLWAARFQLANSVPYFPPGTVHVAVVDPGVGSVRRAIAIQYSQGWLVGPDNGLFSGVLERYPAQKVVSLSDRSYWRERSPSFTFQGRDIFAPVAAHLAQGVALEALGEAIAPHQLVQLTLPALEFEPVFEPAFEPAFEPNPESKSGSKLVQEAIPERIWATVQHLDHFGNGITTLGYTSRGGALFRAAHGRVRMGNSLIPGGKTYGAVEPGAAVALWGSHGWLEIAVNQGSARVVLGLAVGDRVEILLGD